LLPEEVAAASGRAVSRETWAVLERYSRLLEEESRRQNLIAGSTVSLIWRRHILDSAQLLRHGRAEQWADVGSGAGLPGLVLAIVGGMPMTLIEPRRLRAEFLRTAALELGLANVRVLPTKVEQITGSFDVITARAVAPLSKLLGITQHLTHAGSVWLAL
jgi:16S rRNA (guanine527-N7)-methyltransferase